MSPLKPNLDHIWQIYLQSEFRAVNKKRLEKDLQESKTIFTEIYNRILYKLNHLKEKCAPEEQKEISSFLQIVNDNFEENGLFKSAYHYIL